MTLLLSLGSFRNFWGWFALLDWSVWPIRLLLFMALALIGCAATEQHPRYANTCDLTDAQSGAPYCLPPPAFFCIPAEEAAKQAENQKPDPRFVAQGVSVFPSKYNVGPNVPVCPPNGTRLTQDQDWKDAKKGAKAIGYDR